MSAEMLVDVRELLSAAEELVREDWESSEEVRLGELALSTGSIATTALDRVTQIGVALIDYRLTEFLPLVTETLVNLFVDASTVGAGDGRSSLGTAGTARRWWDIAARVYVLGAFAVYREEFQVLPDMVLQVGRPQYEGRPWLRDTVTFLARSNQLTGKSLIPVVGEFVTTHPAFFSRFRSNADAVINALCQFDFMQCVIALVKYQELGACYPNFGIYHNERTEPVVRSLVTKGKAREALPDVEDALLAEVINTLDQVASQEFFAFNGWSRNSWRRREVSQFVAKSGDRVD